MTDHIQMAKELREKGLFQEALNQYQEAVKLKPDSYDALIGMGQILDMAKQQEAALTVYKRAFSVNPDSTEARESVEAITSKLIEKYHARGMTFKDIARMDEAVVSLKRVLELAPDKIESYQNLLLMMVASSVSPEEQADAAKQFGERFANSLQRTKAFLNSRDADRKLRIGYISPNFCHHPVNYFFGHLLELHNRDDFEVFLYSNTPKEDEITEKIKQQTDHWRDIRGIDDNEAANLIEKDNIDILIDLAGHTPQNRLMIFARKPAPIQITWLGYPATTGLNAMDYRITDIYSEPEGKTENLSIEILWRLPEIFCCYKARDNSPDVINQPPFEKNNYITFGCFNNFAKVNENVLRTWAKIMERVPDAHLLLEVQNISHPDFQADVKNKLLRSGLPPGRVLIEETNHANQYKLYNRIDIALDPYPCNGGTTSMDTMWMGVPFVALAGRHFVSRMGVTILTNAGLPELIANNEDEYIKIAVDLANDRDRLKKMRNGLRDRVKASPLMDQERFALNMEAAYREMWRKWCASNPE